MVRIWDSATGQLLRTLSRDDSLVRALAYYPDGTQLVTVGADGVVRWDTSTGALVDRTDTLTEYADWALVLAYHPDGTQLAIAFNDRDDGGIWIWDITVGSRPDILTRHPSTVRALAYHPDGTQLAIASDDGGIWIWDTTVGSRPDILTRHPSTVRALAYHPDGTQLAIASDDGGHPGSGTPQSAVARTSSPGTRAPCGRSPTTPTAPNSPSPATTAGSGSGTPRRARRRAGTVEDLSDGELALWDGETGDLLGATSGACYWPGLVRYDRRHPTQLPAETQGPLRPVPGLAN